MKTMAAPPQHRPAEPAILLDAMKPRLVVPIHWDNLFRPLNKPTRRDLEPP